MSNYMDPRILTVIEAEDWLQHIKNIAGDDEAAHSSEDTLRESVLLTIQDLCLRCHNPHDIVLPLIKVALSTSDIEFARWCA